MDEGVNIPFKIKDLGAFRIDSFNYMINLFSKGNLDIDPVYTESKIKISVSRLQLKHLQYPMDLRKIKRKVFPSEARLRYSTYDCELDVQLCIERGDDMEYCSRTFFIPAMIKSDVCVLKNFNDEQLIKVKEDINDPGGYFIVSGKERLFRHFVVPRRNYPLAVRETKWKTYREGYSEYGIKIRCVKDECLFSNVYIHFVANGYFEIRLYYGLSPYFLQFMLILKALVDRSDAFIVQSILKYEKDFPLAILKDMLHTLHDKGIHSHDDAKFYLGRMFLPILKLPDETLYSDASEHLLKRTLLIHLDSFEEKFEFLCFSLCKLHCAASGKIRVDDLDNPVYQEILSTGQVYMIVLKDGITTYLESVKNILEKASKNKAFKMKREQLLKHCNQGLSIRQNVKHVLTMGDFLKGRHYGLPVNVGLTIALKRTNVFEVAAQLNAVCKISMEHYPRNIRVYYPESYGFLCPAQTPEGENCGLYNQLASQCKIVSSNSRRINPGILFSFWVLPCSDLLIFNSHNIFYPVFVDGIVIGFINQSLVGKLLYKLRELKSLNSQEVPCHSEIICISENMKLYSGIYLFSAPCRMVRKVFNVLSQKEEFIGMFEQLFVHPHGYMNDIIPGGLQYSEIKGADILSLSARMIPFSENNATVRNIFSCVKCKQALGVPFLNFTGRSDSKTLHLIHSQSPVVSNEIYSESDFDFYPFGMNVVVAILSYSGYDMEDALVLNKSSVERGLMGDMMYKAICYDFEELAKEYECKVSDLELQRDEMDLSVSNCLDKTGIPHIGIRVRPGDPILSVFIKNKRRYKLKKYLERYDAYIHSVKFTGDIPTIGNMPKEGNKIVITYSKMRLPEVGDKFTNRHGGKSICSFLMPSEDLPFSESGLVPDILFNPHGLPSRMPIGMLFEMAAGKLSVQKGSKCVLETFESQTFGKKTYKGLGEALSEAGFNYYGTETFYSGTSGEELAADVFCGCMYYMRLHHVVEEKYQVQAIGPDVDEKTNQPMNPGKSGAVRFGEMERDAILSHGAMELTRDRLLLNSDKCEAYVCTKCHLLIYPTLQDPSPELRDLKLKVQNYCELCQKKSSFKLQIPYSLIYLATELAVMGVKLKIMDK